MMWDILYQRITECSIFFKKNKRTQLKRGYIYVYCFRQNIIISEVVTYIFVIEY